MQSLSRLTLFLCCAWAASLLYGEMVAYWVPLWACSWPGIHPQNPSSLTGDPTPNSKNQVNIAVIADPQLMDKTSLPFAPRSFAFEAAKFYTDLYMRRSFLASILPFKPDLIIFLGDQFDGGPFLTDEEWHESLIHFRNVFYLRDEGKHSDIKVHYLSGNHDIGYAGFHPLYEKVINRYEEGFGARNYRFKVQKVEFIVVDAQTLDGPKQGNLTLMSWEFIKNISKEPTSNPRVLLTHIPLYRPNETPCGPYRSSPIINQRVSYAGIDHGVSYQNYLTEDTSRRLLDLIRPVLILSGHDHDQCTVTHSTSLGPVTEHTLGSVSWQQGNLYPSFMLLSVGAPASSNTTDQEYVVSTHLCFLPMQTHIYIWYLALFIITILLVTFWPTSGLGCWDRCGHFVSYIKEAINSIFSAPSKEKDEDENCEYEMVWDAEGSMHLVKKVVTSIPRATSSDTGLTGRGGVIARPQARKHIMQEAGASVALEMNVDMKLDDVGKGPRFSKSKVLKVIQRLIRVLRLLTIIAAVNVPVYMMLLFKDWMER